MAAYAKGQNAEAARTAFSRVAEHDPFRRAAESLLLVLSFYERGGGAVERLEAHRAWVRRWLPGGGCMERPPGYRHERLRVGYVSWSFLLPPRVCFLRPVVEHHDRERVEVYCYTGTRGEGGSLDGCLWRETVGWSAAEMAALVRADEIDVLVNLDGHFQDTTLPLFGGRAAPAMVSFPNYPGSLGLETVRHRISDAVADPPGWSEGHYDERLWRLPCFLPFGGPAVAPRLDQVAPWRRNGFTTFGVFGNPIKINRVSLECWARVLRRAEQARLVFHHPNLAGAGVRGSRSIDGAIRERLRAPFAEAGVADERVAFVGGLVEWDHLDFHNEVDVLLDTYPYSGQTTTLEAAWMGVPTLCWWGEAFVSRMAAAIMAHCGAGDAFAAGSEAEYEERSVELGRDFSAGGEWREVLGQRLRESVLVAGQREYARGLEEAYLEMVGLE